MSGHAERFEVARVAGGDGRAAREGGGGDQRVDGFGRAALALGGGAQAAGLDRDILADRHERRA